MWYVGIGDFYYVFLFTDIGVLRLKDRLELVDAIFNLVWAFLWGNITQNLK